MIKTILKHLLAGSNPITTKFLSLLFTMLDKNTNLLYVATIYRFCNLSFCQLIRQYVHLDYDLEISNKFRVINSDYLVH